VKRFGVWSCWLVLAACGEAPATAPETGLGLGRVLGDDGASGGFARALSPPELRFPRDHGAHRDFRTEWWYVTGNVDAADGRRFGVQLVFFRQALAREVPERGASLAARELIFAHAR
jgi:predicted secreted hydrolase